MDIGLEQAGIEVILASEIDKASRQTIIENRPNIKLIGDIREYDSKQLRQIAGLSTSEEVDLIVGGPPCQSFSSAGCRLGFGDDRGNLFLNFISVALELYPKYILIENVRGLLSAPLLHRPHDKRGKGYPPLTTDELKGGALLHALNILRNAGYGVSFNLYNAANYGTPQIRERVIILCSRDGSEMPFLTPTHSENGEYGLPRWNTFRLAVQDLHSSPRDFVKFPEKRLKYYRMLKAGQNWRDLPKELQKEALGKSYYAGGGKTGFLRRLAWDKPAPTLVTHPAMPATDLAHPEEDRPLSIQEYKRIQQFPDDWKISGSIIDQYRQIGNAVPIRLGLAAGKTIMEHHEGKQVLIYKDFKYSRYRDTDHKKWELSINRELSKSAQIGFDFLSPSLT